MELYYEQTVGPFRDGGWRFVPGTEPVQPDGERIAEVRCLNLDARPQRWCIERTAGGYVVTAPAARFRLGFLVVTAAGMRVEGDTTLFF